MTESAGASLEGSRQSLDCGNIVRPPTKINGAANTANRWELCLTQRMASTPHRTKIAATTINAVDLPVAGKLHTSDANMTISPCQSLSDSQLMDG
jgi:hypothetical protein